MVRVRIMPRFTISPLVATTYVNTKGKTPLTTQKGLCVVSGVPVLSHSDYLKEVRKGLRGVVLVTLFPLPFRWGIN